MHHRQLYVTIKTHLIRVVRNKSGVVVVFFALLLPVILLVIALLIDGSFKYIRYSKIDNLSKAGANIGLIALNNLFEERALEIKQNCSEPGCQNIDNIFYFLDSTATEEIINTNKELIIQHIADFINTYDNKNISEKDIEILFPYKFTIGESVSIKVILRSKEKTLFDNNILGVQNEKPISSTAVSKILLK